jgi:hypothetical protein
VVFRVLGKLLSRCLLSPGSERSDCRQNRFGWARHLRLSTRSPRKQPQLFS